MAVFPTDYHRVWPKSFWHLPSHLPEIITGLIFEYHLATVRFPWVGICCKGPSSGSRLRVRVCVCVGQDIICVAGGCRAWGRSARDGFSKDLQQSSRPGAFHCFLSKFNKSSSFKKKKSVLNKERYASQPASLENFSYRLIPSFSEMGFLWC